VKGTNPGVNQTAQRYKKVVREGAGVKGVEVGEERWGGVLAGNSKESFQLYDEMLQIGFAPYNKF
jgi:hypothetical protein